MEAGSTIDESLSRFPRVELTRLPTPLHHLQWLSQRVGPAVYLKRDDLTDLTLGGDKPRKLEYELALAQQADATVLVTCGSAQSNHARLTTAAARRIGLDCAVVLSRDAYHTLQGNLLTVNLMGATVRIAETDDHWALESAVQNLIKDLTTSGQRPYYIPISGTTPTSCLGYVRAGLEWVDQLAAREIQPTAIYTPFGTGGIFAGVLLAIRERGLTCPLIGISVNRDRRRCLEKLDHWWGNLCRLLHRNPTQTREPFEIDDSFVGKAYGDPTSAGLEAIRRLAESEGILMDPVYSGKVLAGMLEHCKAKGRWSDTDRVTLLHSGGVPALFAYHQELQQHLAAARQETLGRAD